MLLKNSGSRGPFQLETVSYFETIGQCIRLGDSQDRFKAGVIAVFPSLESEDPSFVDSLLHQLYAYARCGLYHSSRTRAGVGLGQPPEEAVIACDSDKRVLVLSPERLPRALIQHLETFRFQLLDPSNAEGRAAFAKWFDQEAEMGSRPTRT